ncbi:hypothetical protein ACFY6E_12450 [Staphylococcus cohnii]|uniref:hypothetical protein n=1 Tax=Staphylococcus cohnii TaxID=29382 RepID=UPI0036ADF414
MDNVIKLPKKPKYVFLFLYHQMNRTNPFDVAKEIKKLSKQQIKVVERDIYIPPQQTYDGLITTNLMKVRTKDLERAIAYVKSKGYLGIYEYLLTNKPPKNNAETVSYYVHLNPKNNHANIAREVIEEIANGKINEETMKFYRLMRVFITRGYYLYKNLKAIRVDGGYEVKLKIESIVGMTGRKPVEISQDIYEEAVIQFGKIDVNRVGMNTYINSEVEKRAKERGILKPSMHRVTIYKDKDGKRQSYSEKLQ